MQCPAGASVKYGAETTVRVCMSYITHLLLALGTYIHTLDLDHSLRPSDLAHWSVSHSTLLDNWLTGPNYSTGQYRHTVQWEPPQATSDKFCSLHYFLHSTCTVQVSAYLPVIYSVNIRYTSNPKNSHACYSKLTLCKISFHNLNSSANYSSANYQNKQCSLHTSHFVK